MSADTYRFLRLDMVRMLTRLSRATIARPFHIYSLAVLMLAGCGTTQRFTRPETTQAQFMQDRYACMQQAEQQYSSAFANQFVLTAGSETRPNCGVWLSCLGARGYVVDPNGSLAAPKDMIVHCHR